MNDERITIGDVMAEPLWINGKSFTAYGLVRRGRSLTSQTAFGGQLPYKGSLGRPATCGLRGCLTKVSAIMCRPFSLWFVVWSL